MPRPISLDSTWTGLQVRDLDAALKRRMLHETIDQTINMATLLQRMWDAYVQQREAAEQG